MNNFFDQFDETGSGMSVRKNFFDQFDEQEDRSTLRGLGLSFKSMLQSVGVLGEQAAATPVQAAAGIGDIAVTSFLEIPTPLALGKKQIPRAVSAIRRYGLSMDALREFGRQTREAYRASPISDDIRKRAPEAYTFTWDAAQQAADRQRKNLAQTQRDIAANRPQGAASGLAYDLATSGVQMLPAIIVTALTRNPALGAAMSALPSAGQQVAEGMDKGLSPSEAFKRAAPLAAAEFVLSKPVEAMLALPARKLLESAVVPQVLKKLAGTSAGRVVGGSAAEGVEESVTQALQEAYDAGVLGEETTLGEALERIGYAGLLGAVAASPYATARAAADSVARRRAASAPDAGRKPDIAPQPEAAAINEQADLSGGDKSKTSESTSGLSPDVARYRNLAGQQTGNPDYYNADLAKELFPEYAASREARMAQSDAVQERASAIRDAAFRQRLAEPSEPGEMVTFMAGGTGSGKSSAMPATGIVYDTTLANADAAFDKIDRVLATGRGLRLIYVATDPVVAWWRVLERSGSAGRGVPLQVHANTHIGANEAVRAIKERYRDDPRVHVDVVDNSGSAPRVMEGIPAFDYNALTEKLHEILETGFKRGIIGEGQFRAAAGTLPGQQRQADHRGPGQALARVHRLAENDRHQKAQSLVNETPPDSGVFASGSSEAANDAGRFDASATASLAADAPAAKPAHAEAGEHARSASQEVEDPTASATRDNAGRTGAVPDLVHALKQRFGYGVDALRHSGVLNVVPSFSDLPPAIRRRISERLDGAVPGAEEDIRALYVGGDDKVYLIADRISAEDAHRVLLHEVGEHYGLQRMIGPSRYARLLGSVRHMQARGEPAVSRAWAYVASRYGHLKPGEDRFVREVIAHVGESADAMKLPWYRGLMQAVRQFLFARGYLRLKLKDDDLRGLVASSLRRSMDEAARGSRRRMGPAAKPPDPGDIDFSIGKPPGEATPASPKHQTPPSGGVSVSGAASDPLHWKHWPHTKPKYSRKPEKWERLGGRIEIDPHDGTWTYIDWEGNAVRYTNGFPDFKAAGLVVKDVNIDSFYNRYLDVRKADKIARTRQPPPKHPDNVWHHHQDGHTMQEMPRELHKRFTHYGGIALLKHFLGIVGKSG